MSKDIDFQGFTKQTEVLLRGVGAQDLIDEFKRRDISTDALRKLTKEDFIHLGADNNQAENIINALCTSKKNVSHVKAESNYKLLLDKVEILQLGERQLNIIQDYVKYCRMKLKKERHNFFVEPDKALSASQILCMVTDATLQEIHEAELKLKELETVILMLFAIIVFGCISSKGYITKEGKEVCLYKEDNNACNYGIGIGVLAFLASIGFLAGEYLFEQMSSVKTRKHFVLIDLGFSGFWSFLYFVGFCYLTNAWNNSANPPGGYGVNNVQAAIAFSFFSIFTWAGCAWFAFQRFKQGTDAAFAPSYEADPVGSTGYTSYPDATDTAYQEPPFGQQQQRGMGDFQAPAY
ncbi:hypothetical protein PUN28_016315 [Cardiocondyla obscurior]|uniref:MARVEL domain-containing protein n=1 Tax=Cardiocondyla obscurior TaxID=286306 RepID=A0AAW2EWY9_9HYME